MDWATTALTIIVVCLILLAFVIKFTDMTNWIEYQYNVFLWKRHYKNSPEYLELIKQEEYLEAAWREQEEKQYQERLTQDKLHSHESIPFPWSSEVLADEED